MTTLSVLDLSPVTEGSTPAQSLEQHARSGAACRAAGLPALLAGRAPQHAGHRQRGDLGGDRPCRGRHQHHPRRRRRHHAAQPRAAGDRRAVRHAGGALSRPHRPRPRPRAGHRHADRARAAPQPRGRRRQFPAGCRRADGLFRARRSRASASAPCPARAQKCRVWMLGSSLFGAQLAAMLGLPYAFASHFAPAELRPGARHLSRALPALGAAGQAAM